MSMNSAKQVVVEKTAYIMNLELYERFITRDLRKKYKLYDFENNLISKNQKNLSPKKINKNNFSDIKLL